MKLWLPSEIRYACLANGLSLDQADAIISALPTRARLLPPGVGDPPTPGLSPRPISSLDGVAASFCQLEEQAGDVVGNVAHAGI